MNGKIAFLFVLAFGACNAQNLPTFSYNVTVLEGDGVSICPDNQQRQDARDAIRDGVRSVVQNDILPLITGGGPVPCPCMATGRRIAYLDMTDPNQQCPPNWTLITSGGLRTCGRTTDIAGSCDSAFFPSGGVPYTRVCGRVIGYQYCSPNAFEGFAVEGEGLDGHYIEGVSVTHGQPRTHVWSFAAAYTETYTGANQWICPCTNTANPTVFQVPPFIGQDYFCETGTDVNPAGCNLATGAQLFTDDPLWDGDGCAATDTCCDRSVLPTVAPWFCRELPQSTTDDIEVRICANQVITNEDTPVELVEIYVS